MQNFFLTRILKYMAGKLDGYKMFIAGFGLICLGITYIIPVMFPGTASLPEGDMDKGVKIILEGLAMIGLGGKIEKNTKAVNNENQRTDYN